MRPEDRFSDSTVETQKEGRLELVRKEALAALVFLLLVCLLSIIADAPLEGPADPAAITGESVKAPWIFCGIQQMLRHISPVLAGLILPLSALLVLGLIPFVARIGRFAQFVLFFAVVVISLLLTAWGYFR